MVAELCAKKLHNTTAFDGTKMTIKLSTFTHQKKHCNTTKRNLLMQSSPL